MYQAPDWVGGAPVIADSVVVAAGASSQQIFREEEDHHVLRKWIANLKVRRLSPIGGVAELVACVEFSTSSNGPCRT